MMVTTRFISLGLAAGFVLPALSSHYFAVAPFEASCEAAVAGQDFPDGVSPSDVFATMDLVERTADVLLNSMGRKSPPAPSSFETGLQPMHVYQLTATCANRVETFSASQTKRAARWIPVAPKQYFPRDVNQLASSMLEELRKAGGAMAISELPQDKREFADKTPTDVYAKAMDVFVKVGVLSGNAKITPNEVFAEMARAAADVKALIEAAGGSVDSSAPAPDGAKSPSDVFTIAVETRQQINQVRAAAGLDEVAMPNPPAGQRFKPIDVFVQAQLILAEINLLKQSAGVSTPAAAPAVVTGKTPTDVWAQVSLIKHFVGQIKGGQFAAAGH